MCILIPLLDDIVKLKHPEQDKSGVTLIVDIVREN